MRRYKAFQGRFLRANMTDESLEPLSYTELSADILAWVRRTITHGFDFAGAHYVFLAFSSSQIREHGFWAYCDPEPGDMALHALGASVRVPSAADIRLEAGVLRSIRVPARWAARLSQCFSTTNGTIDVAAKEVTSSSP